MSGAHEGVLRLEEMTWQEVDRLDREHTVTPSSADPSSNTDRRPLWAPTCTLARHGYTVIVAPRIPYVNALFSLPYPGSVSVRRRVVEEYLFDVLSSFAASGFTYLMPVSQHVEHVDPPWARAAQSACDRVNDERGARAIHGFERLVADLLADPSQLGDETPDLTGDSHAGVTETAAILHLDASLLRKRYLQELPPQPTDFSRMGDAVSFRELGNGLGYTGDLSNSSAELGKRILDYYTQRFNELTLQHLSGEDVRERLRFSSF